MITIRCTETERNLINARAKAANESVQSMALSFLLGKPPKLPPITVEDKQAPQSPDIVAARAIVTRMMLANWQTRGLYQDMQPEDRERLLATWSSILVAKYSTPPQAD